MAESIALTTLIGQAVDLIKKYAKVISGAKEEVSDLKRKLISLDGLVDKLKKEKDAEAKVCKDWLKQIKEVLFDVEDAFAESDSHKIRASVLYRWCSYQQTYDHAAKIKILSAEVKKTYEELHKVFTDLPAAPPISDHAQRRRNQKKPREKNLVLLERETNELINVITITDPEKEKYKVIPIVGMAGLGKTTLAWRIFSHASIQAEFPKLFWVKVSYDYNEKEMLQSVLKTSTKEDVEASSGIESLKEKVRRVLERGKFLIIFDDVWSVDAWNDIQDLFSLPSRNDQGRVLITTRNNRVVRHAVGPNYHHHYMRTLDERESWELLQLEVFDNLYDCPANLAKIGKKLSDRCKGLPLSIVIIGGILRDKWKREGEQGTAKEWNQVLSNPLSDVINEYQGDSGTRTDSIINLGYEHLRPGLKDCFLYLGMFPEDAEISVWKLKHLWIAEEYIHAVNGWSLEETAEHYVKDLVDMNLLMAAKTKPDGEIKTCHVHDLVRAFCIRKAENTYKEIKLSAEGVFEPEKEAIQAWRHVSIHSRVMDYFVSSSPNLKKVRSFLSFSNEVFETKKKQVPSATDAFGVLRVLDMNMARNFPKFPFKLTQLILLKYVTLSSVEFKVLPKEIYSLRKLQILQVYTSSPTLEIKADIWRMTKLKHFKTKASIILISKKRDLESGKGGELLHSLNRLSPQSCTAEVFNKAKNLMELGIRGDLKKLSFPILSELDLLQKLKLAHKQLDDTSLDKKHDFLVQPTWFPKTLKNLTLSGTHLKWEMMSKLGEIGTLEVLKLNDNAFTGHRWEALDTGFDSLESLHISDADLVTWVLACNTKSLPNLRKVVLKNCKELSVVPDSLVKRLELLHMDGIREFAASSAQKIYNTMLKLAKKSSPPSLKLVLLRVDTPSTSRALVLV